MQIAPIISAFTVGLLGSLSHSGSYLLRSLGRRRGEVGISRPLYVGNVPLQEFHPLAFSDAMLQHMPAKFSSLFSHATFVTVCSVSQVSSQLLVNAVTLWLHLMDKQEELLLATSGLCSCLTHGRVALLVRGGSVSVGQLLLSAGLRPGKRVIEPKCHSIRQSDLLVTF